MRDMDRPDEVLEDEDVTVSLPRRLGLSDVIGVQIRRFQEEVRQRRLQSGAQVADLIRLVIRRPDAEDIFLEAGRRMARRDWEQRAAPMRGTITFMPRPVAPLAAHRASRRLFRRLTAGRVSISRLPLEMRIRSSLSAQADSSGAACSFYTGAFGELLQLYTGRQYRVRHAHCEARGDAECSWLVEVAS